MTEKEQFEVELEVDGTVVDTATVFLEQRQDRSTDTVMQWTDTDVTSGQYDITVSVDDVDDSGFITVKQLEDVTTVFTAEENSIAQDVATGDVVSEIDSVGRSLTVAGNRYGFYSGEKAFVHAISDGSQVYEFSDMTLEAYDFDMTRNHATVGQREPYPVVYDLSDGSVLYNGAGESGDTATFNTSVSSDYFTAETDVRRLSDGSRVVNITPPDTSTQQSVEITNNYYAGETLDSIFVHELPSGSEAWSITLDRSIDDPTGITISDEYLVITYETRADVHDIDSGTTVASISRPSTATGLFDDATILDGTVGLILDAGASGENDTGWVWHDATSDWLDPLYEYGGYNNKGAVLSIDSTGTFSSPPVEGTAVFSISDGPNNAYQLNASSGAEEWVQSVGSGPSDIVPTRNGDAIYVSTATEIYRLTNSGSVDWNVGGFDSPSRLTPAPDDSTVYTIDGNVSTSLADDGTIYSLNASDGSQNWTYETANERGSAIGVDVNNDVVYGGDQGGNIYALNSNDGSEKWMVQPASSPVQSIVANRSNDTIYSGTNGNVVRALDTSGSEKWVSSDLGRSVNRVAPDPTGGVVYCTSGSTVAQLNASDGSTNWSFVLPETRPSVGVGPAGETIFTAGERPDLVRAIDVATKRTVWYQELADWPKAVGVVQNNYRPPQPR